MRNLLIGVVLVLGCAATCFATAPNRLSNVSTFSIVGFDPETGELGIAVASKFLAVGAVVPWASAGVGAVATQSYANTMYGPEGLALLASGLDPHEVLDQLTGADEGRERRQAGIVDAVGRSATFTGKECIAWAGGKAGKYYACQGNILVDETTVTAMAETFGATVGPLGLRLVKALKAGEEAGGDSRGKQSASLLVVKEAGGYLGLNDRYIDLRVDDHNEPVEELSRLLAIQLSYSALFEASALKEDGDLKGARGAALKAVKLNPTLPDALYDLACYYSLSGMKDEALATLGEALALSPGFKKMAREDSDLEALRQDKAFKAMVEE
ncbi:MAG: DUF1028 domain-containing protein [Candidatus Eisenbacteria bacterium]